MKDSREEDQNEIFSMTLFPLFVQFHENEVSINVYPTQLRLGHPWLHVRFLFILAAWHFVIVIIHHLSTIKRKKKGKTTITNTPTTHDDISLLKKISLSNNPDIHVNVGKL